MGTRWLLVTTAAVVSLALAAILVGWPAVMREPGLTPALAAAFAGTLVAVAFGLEVLVRVPLLRLAESLDLVARRDFTTVIDVNAGGEIGALAQGILDLRRQLKSANDEIGRLGERCQTAEQALRE